MAGKRGNIKEIGRRYARAFFTLAESSKSLDKVEKEILAIEKLVLESPDFGKFISSPALSSKTRIAAIEQINKKAGFSKITGQFLMLLAKNRRMALLPEVIAAFKEELSNHRGEVKAEVISARALSDKAVASISGKIGEVTGGKAVIERRVDPALIGGVVVKFRSRMYDFSVKSRLDKLQIAMKKSFSNQ